MAWFAGLGTAFWLGLLTSVSPCPLATNVAAVSYISRQVKETRLALLSGLLYAAGRTAVYVALGIGLSASLLSAPEVSFWLQRVMNRLLGPLLVLVGMVLLGLLGIPSGGGSAWMEKLRGKAGAMGVWGAGFLGMLFALSFCPTSAVLFFGSLVPLTVKAGAVIAYPAVYGLGTALPVVGFGTAAALGAKGVGKAFERVRELEVWARRVTGGLILLVGLYLSVMFIFLA